MILLESPLKISFKKALVNLFLNKPISGAFEMDHIFPTKIHVVDKNTGEIMPQEFVTEPQFTFT